MNQFSKDAQKLLRSYRVTGITIRLRETSVGYTLEIHDEMDRLGVGDYRSFRLSPVLHEAEGAALRVVKSICVQREQKRLRLTFQDHYEHWIETGNWSISTRSMYKSKFENVWLPIFAARLPGEVTLEEIRNVLEGRPASSSQQYRACLSAFFSYLQSGSFVVEHPIRGIRLCKENGTTTKCNVAYRVEEIADFLSLLPEWDRDKKVRVRDAVAICAFAGLRPGEALGLKASDLYTVDLNGQTIPVMKISRHIKCIDGKNHIIEGRKRGDMLEMQIAGGLYDRLVSIPLRSDKKEWLLFRSGVEPFEATSLRYHCQLASKATGMKLTPRDFRRWFATAINRMGASIDHVSRLLGHAHQSTTEAHYSDRSLAIEVPELKQLDNGLKLLQKD